MSDKIKNPPDVRRIVEGLRDTGYQFTTAVADVIDNAISAGATLINITIVMDFLGKVTLTISDNGYGMDEKEIIEAMRYGSNTKKSPLSLGKYGLGLKTASTAFCRRLVVLSRSSSDDSVKKAVWDLDHITKVNDWELILDKATDDEIKSLDATTNGSAGSLVIWDKVDRLVKNYKSPGSQWAKRALDQHIENLKKHIAMVYQRYLDSEDNRAPTVSIYVNNQKIKSWDPFCVTYSEKVAADDVEVEIIDGESNNLVDTIYIRAYILPREEEFPDIKLKENAEIGIEKQGIYIYRENRLISGPSWFGFYSQAPNLNQLRVDFSFSHKLDSAFSLDIKKSQIILNEDLEDHLKNKFLTAPIRAAREVWKQGSKNKIQKLATTVHGPSNLNIQDKEKEVVSSEIKIIDETKGIVEVTNLYGKSQIKIPISQPNNPGEVFIKTVTEIQDGMLWEPAIIDGHHAVNINQNHEYYNKVYIPNINSNVLVQGLDSFLWALTEAELSTINEKVLAHFLELRYEVSKILRRLVKDLPEPELEQTDG